MGVEGGSGVLFHNNVLTTFLKWGISGRAVGAPYRKAPWPAHDVPMNKADRKNGGKKSPWGNTPKS